MSDNTDKKQASPAEPGDQLLENLESRRLAETIATFANTGGGVIRIHYHDMKEVERIRRKALRLLTPCPKTQPPIYHPSGEKQGYAELTVTKADHPIRLPQKAEFHIGEPGASHSQLRKLRLRLFVTDENADGLLALRRGRKEQELGRETWIKIFSVLIPLDLVVIVAFFLGGRPPLSILIPLAVTIISFLGWLVVVLWGVKFRRKFWATLKPAMISPLTGAIYLGALFVLFLLKAEFSPRFVIALLAAPIIGVVLIGNLLISYKRSLEAKIEYNRNESGPVREKPSKSSWLQTWKEYELHINLYRYYLDIGLKVTVFFFLVTGAILGFYLQHPGWMMRLSLVFPFLMCLAFVGISFHGAILWSRITYIIKDIRKELGVKKSPDINLLTILLVVYGVVFLIIGIGIAWLAMGGDELLKWKAVDNLSGANNNWASLLRRAC